MGEARVKVAEPQERMGRINVMRPNDRQKFSNSSWLHCFTCPVARWRKDKLRVLIETAANFEILA